MHKQVIITHRRSPTALSKEGDEMGQIKWFPPSYFSFSKVGRGNRKIVAANCLLNGGDPFCGFPPFMSPLPPHIKTFNPECD